MSVLVTDDAPEALGEDAGGDEAKAVVEARAGAGGAAGGAGGAADAAKAAATFDVSGGGRRKVALGTGMDSWKHFRWPHWQ